MKYNTLSTLLLSAAVLLLACGGKETVPSAEEPADNTEQTPGEDNPGGDNPGGDNPGGDNPGGDTPGDYTWPNSEESLDYGLAPGETVTAKYTKADLTASGNLADDGKALSGPATTQKVTYMGPGVTYYGNRMTIDQVRNWNTDYPEKTIPKDRCMSFKINRPGRIKFYGAPNSGIIPTYHLAVVTKVKGVESAKVVTSFTPTEVANGSLTENRTDANIYSADWAKYWITMEIPKEALTGMQEPATVYFYCTYTKNASVGYWPIIWTSSETNPPLPGRKPKFILAGDSTCTTYSDPNIAGWGMYLSQALGDDAKILNLAVGGRSTKSFIKEGKWLNLLDNTIEGDIVTIQFGHNDYSTAEDRHTVLDGNSAEEYGNYQPNLRKMVADVKAKKAIPILVTSINTRTFDSSGNPTCGFKAYVEAMKAVATETNTLLIDINAQTQAWLKELGPDGSVPYYVMDKRDPEAMDNTHLTRPGAEIVAGMVAQGIKDLGLWPVQ